QDYQSFLDNGGKIGLQHDVLLYGAYNLNPFLVNVELVPMLIVQQGQVAVIKSYVGLATQDTSGASFKFGSLVRPGHRGVWQEPLRTGKYAINPRIYNAEIVPTAILTLNWADATSKAHNLDKELKQIIAKSREGFIFNIDLQVQIHVPDTLAPRVISMVGTMQNLANEVLQAAVGNHFRDKLQSMPAVTFIETRQEVQNKALDLITEKLSVYQVETKGVYIQDVVFPAELVKVLTSREIANQEIETYRKERQAEDERIEMEKAKGTADMQKELAASKVGVDIQRNNAEARKATADGESTYLERVGNAKGAEPRSVGLANAEAYAKQVQALGMQGTMLVNIANALSHSQQPFMPGILVNGGGGALDALAAALTGKFSGNGGTGDSGTKSPSSPKAPVTAS
ncbi:MAG: SPFH domain-containing protein, partial [Rudaea sp.]